MKEWLSGIVGEGTANIVGFILIFAIILGGIFVVLSLIRRFGGGFSATAARSRQPRLSVMDAAAVDSRRKLVLIRRDDVEHLLLIGGPTDVVVEQNIGREDRAAPRLQQTSRIEPEHIERFRQHEAAIAGDRNERPALSSRNPAAPEQPERDEAIQLSSAIETPMQRQQEPEPEPEKEEPVRQQPAAAQRPQPPRAAPNIPPLPPRTVVPPRPQPPQAQSARAHPAYPLSQVSRGVVSATSSASNAAVAPAAAAAASLGSIVPERESLQREPVVGNPDPAPQSAAPAPAQRVEPELPLVAAPAGNEELEGLGSELHDAIMADLQEDIAATDKAAKPQADDFEDALLSSLDISAADHAPSAKSSQNIEDEMEKLLGDLSRTEHRHG